MPPFWSPLLSHVNAHKLAAVVGASFLVLGLTVANILMRFAPELLFGHAAAPIPIHTSRSDYGQYTYDLQAITASHLFGSVAPPPKGPVPPIRSKLPLRLFGVISGTDKHLTRALIGTEAGLPRSYMVGQTVRGTDAQVHRIEPGRVILERSAVLEQLELHQPRIAKRVHRPVLPSATAQMRKRLIPSTDQPTAGLQPPAAQGEIDQRRFQSF